MKNAWERREEYTTDGRKLRRRETAIGPIVPWSIVVILALFLGGAAPPPSFWQFLSRWITFLR
jgi:hypothetical protein